MLIECHFLRPNPRQQCKFNVFHVVSGVPCWSSQVSPAGRGGQSVSSGFTGLCCLSHNQNVYVALHFSIPKQLGVPYYAPSYTHTHTLLHCHLCGVVQLPVPKVMLYSSHFYPGASVTKPSLAFYRLPAGLHWQADLLKILKPCILGVCHFFPSPPLLYEIHVFFLHIEVSRKDSLARSRLGLRINLDAISAGSAAMLSLSL